MLWKRDSHLCGIDSFFFFVFVGCYGYRLWSLHQNPWLSEARQEERRRRSFQDYTGQKITLEAVLNTTCKKCGCKGHFAKDCFMQPGGTKYSLIPDEEEEKEEAKSAEFEKPDPTRNSSRKRKKEKKKKKHRDRKSSDSDSSDSESDTGKRARHTSKDSKAAKKKKKKKKHKKKHKERSYYPLQLPLPEPDSRDSCKGVQAAATGTAVEASLAVVGRTVMGPPPSGLPWADCVILPGYKGQPENHCLQRLSLCGTLGQTPEPHSSSQDHCFTLYLLLCESIGSTSGLCLNSWHKWKCVWF
uniref:Zinc finger CCHC-type containing 17 n=3 Tax=Canis lupus familiaris TaxID=9615 RepID=A0A8I3N099_CANLF